MSLLDRGLVRVLCLRFPFGKRLLPSLLRGRGDIVCLTTIRVLQSADSLLPAASRRPDTGQHQHPSSPSGGRAVLAGARRTRYRRARYLQCLKTAPITGAPGRHSPSSLQYPQGLVVSLRPRLFTFLGYCGTGRTRNRAEISCLPRPPQHENFHPPMLRDLFRPFTVVL